MDEFGIIRGLLIEIGLSFSVPVFLRMVFKVFNVIAAVELGPATSDTMTRL